MKEELSFVKNGQPWVAVIKATPTALHIIGRGGLIAFVQLLDEAWREGKTLKLSHGEGEVVFVPLSEAGVPVAITVSMTASEVRTPK